MQGFSAVHLQNIRTVSAVLAKAMQKNSGVVPSAPSVEFPVSHESSHTVVVVPASQSTEDITAKQLASLISQQEATAQDLQAIVVQLEQLTELTKQLKNDAELFYNRDFQDNYFESPSVVENKNTPVKTELAFEKTETRQTSQAYFFNLPWSSEVFAEAAAKMRESSPTAQVPQIMQLATDSALKTAADAAFLGDANPVQSQVAAQTCGDYFQALPWIAETAWLSTNVVTAKQNSSVNDSISNTPTPAVNEEQLQVIEAEASVNLQAQNCGRYFQALPWLAKTTIELSAPNIPLQTDDEFLKTLLQEVEQLSPQQEISPPQNCDRYFQSLPWTAEKLVSKEDTIEQPQTESEHVQKRKAMLGAIFANKAAIDDQDFLQMLEQTPNPNQAAPEEKNYFQTLPWG